MHLEEKKTIKNPHSNHLLLYCVVYLFLDSSNHSSFGTISTYLSGLIGIDTNPGRGWLNGYDGKF